MKTRRKDKLVEVLVLKKFQYSLNGFDLLTAQEGDVVELRSWQAKSFSEAGKATEEIPPEEEEDEEEEEEDESYTVEELKGLSETDFAELTTTKQLQEWSKVHLVDLEIKSRCKPETALKKIFEHIESL